MAHNKARQQRKNNNARRAKSREKAAREFGSYAKKVENRFTQRASDHRSVSKRLGELATQSPFSQLLGGVRDAPLTEEQRDRNEKFLERMFGGPETKPFEVKYRPRLIDDSFILSRIIDNA